MRAAEHVEMLIVGAGISGIDAAYRLQERRPQSAYVILEARGAIGGTWDLFRYPGIRSDSDMYTLGFPFRPWTGEKAIADGGDIRTYVEETAQAYGIDRHIRFGHRVTRASWSSEAALWTVEAKAGAETRLFTCRFLYLASGYYDYASGYRPEWAGEADFEGRIVHPQHWPEDLDHAGKRVVVIGSGATAVTLVPAMARTAAHVTMLQRSPSWIVSRPSRDALALWAQKRLPAGLAARLVRWKNVALGIGFFQLARRRPERVKKAILKGAAEQLPEGYDVERDFAARYDPWDQRLCLVPDGDLFAGVSSGKVSVVTGEIERFTRDGVRLRSGEELPADIIVTATGLVMRMMGGIAVEVDGERVEPGERLAWKGMMLSGVPNAALAFGYTNASWTLKCDLTARWAARLLDHMDKHGYRICVPRLPEGEVERQPLLDFSSGYVRRAEAILPKQGARAPWRVHQNYVRDVAAMRWRRVDDEGLHFA